MAGGQVRILKIFGPCVFDRVEIISWEDEKIIVTSITPFPTIVSKAFFSRVRIV